MFLISAAAFAQDADGSTLAPGIMTTQSSACSYAPSPAQAGSGLEHNLTNYY